MKIAKTHRRLLSNRSFRFGCEKSVFSPAEIAALERFGYVMETLVAGKIRAVTPDEKRFVLLAVGNEPRPGNQYMGKGVGETPGTP